MTPPSRSSTERRGRRGVATVAAAHRSAFSRLLLTWYDRARRDLPWRRRENDPYAVWLSEMMLQQTQVATVLRYFEPFLNRFPTIHILAAAPLDDVMHAWAGLGYYARARNLHRAANEIIESHGGEIPRAVEALMRLPGVGRYTAGAVTSIAFGVRASVVDGNVARVLARCFGIEADFKSIEGRAAFWSLADTLLPFRRSGDFNQALMELGATVCRPRSPACAACPLARRCVGRLEERLDSLPASAPARPRRAVRFITIVVRAGDRILIRRRPSDGLWGGLWELPSVRLNERTRARSAFGDVLPEGVLAKLAPVRPIGELSHDLTHLRAQFRLYEAVMRGCVPRAANGFRWIHPGSLRDVGLGTVQRRLVELHLARRS